VFLICYSVTDSDSLVRAEKVCFIFVCLGGGEDSVADQFNSQVYLPEIRRITGPGGKRIPVILVGTKLDEHRQVSREEAEAAARRMKAVALHEISARFDLGLQRLFEEEVITYAR
jgi:hypothetical protein